MSPQYPLWITMSQEEAAPWRRRAHEVTNEFLERGLLAEDDAAEVTMLLQEGRPYEALRKALDEL